MVVQSHKVLMHRFKFVLFLYHDWVEICLYVVKGAKFCATCQHFMLCTVCATLDHVLHCIQKNLCSAGCIKPLNSGPAAALLGVLTVYRDRNQTVTG